MVTLTCGPVSLAMMVIDADAWARWQLGPGGQETVIFFILAVDADAWARHYFFGMKLSSLNY
jgi:hypothetical protein